MDSSRQVRNFLFRFCKSADYLIIAEPNNKAFHSSSSPSLSNSTLNGVSSAQQHLEPETKRASIAVPVSTFARQQWKMMRVGQTWRLTAGIRERSFPEIRPSLVPPCHYPPRTEGASCMMIRGDRSDWPLSVDGRVFVPTNIPPSCTLSQRSQWLWAGRSMPWNARVFLPRLIAGGAKLSRCDVRITAATNKIPLDM